MRCHFLLVAASYFACSPAWSQAGYLHGADHCFYFAAPGGWTLDNRSGAPNGVPMVSYPIGSSWKSAKDAIYARVATFKPGPSSNEQKIKVQVSSVLDLYLKSSPSVALTAAKSQDLQGAGGEQGELWRFKGYPNGAEEQVAYFVGRQTVNFFVLQIARSEPSPPSAEKLIELASSYKEATDCVPCKVSGACTPNN